MKTESKFLYWKNINLEIGKKVKTGFCQSKMEYVPILRNVSGYAKSGECLAIMGGSGAGKSTMLNIISGRFGASSNVKLTGEVKLNGEV